MVYETPGEHQRPDGTNCGYVFATNGRCNKCGAVRIDAPPADPREELLVARAAVTARLAHHGQVYDGRNFFDAHVEGVVRQATLLSDDERVHAVAYLHDVLEDSSLTERGLRGMFPDDVVDAVVYLTRETVGRQPYSDYIALLAVSPDASGRIARLVKFADLTFNRANCIRTTSHRGLIQRYTEALERLLPVIRRDLGAGLI